MSLRTESKRAKTIADIASVEGRVSTMLSQATSIFSDLGNLQTFINNKVYFTADEKTEIQTIIDEAYKAMWDDAVARTPKSIKDTNRV